MRNKLILTGLAIFAIAVGAYFLLGTDAHFGLTSQKQIVSPTQTISSDVITYAGKEGTDALTLLKSKATMMQSSTGLVTEINGRKADDSKHEYWAFYVNGKMAPVGPADYKTKTNDIIEWKIERY